jgi:hypothetical protein
LKKKKRKIVKRKVSNKDVSWKNFLNKHNGGHSTTIFGIVVDMNGKPITGKL